jgi:hypothetical protein
LWQDNVLNTSIICHYRGPEVALSSTAAWPLPVQQCFYLEIKRVASPKLGLERYCNSQSQTKRIQMQKQTLQKAKYREKINLGAVMSNILTRKRQYH